MQKYLHEMSQKSHAITATNEAELAIKRAQETAVMRRSEDQQYLEGKRFLERLTPTIDALRQQTSERFLDGTYAARGGTVPELVADMTKNGLSFAGCNPGDEAVYYALHDMFVAYTTSAQAAAGFQVRYNPPRTDPWKVK